MAALHALTQCSRTLAGTAAAVRLTTMTMKVKTARGLVFSILFFPHNCLLFCQRASLPAKVAIEELDNDVQSVPGLRNIYVVEKPVKESFPDMQIGFNA